MELLSTIIALIKRQVGPKTDFAGLAPDDLEAYYRLDAELDAAEREGGEAAKKAVWARHGIRGAGQWQSVQCSFIERHGKSAEFLLANARVQMQIQIEEMRERYPFPPELIAPIEGVGLDRLSLIESHLAKASPAEAGSILAQYGIDAERFERVRAGWNGRISHGDPIITNSLWGFAHTFRSVADSWLSSRAAG